ncbi:hypothetical protein MWU75_12640 [Ornithinimicrobium sp. F0845]|uniref:hypothetical protein n=1 Tax=Ornithinimicrobium sp. F0845 TaxID=2926412 RepID=UPI001FF0F687|nr:hypothetical protein [Ornithinimicrobium sp. F0845]MCK0112989.1 hypothetical protein [Ornithinimicrobium sp. F0845]
MGKTTMPTSFGEPDIPLTEALLGLLRNGPRDVGWLAARARARLRDATIDEESVITAVHECTLLVGRPDGAVVRLLDLLEGQVLTHRVSEETAGRVDLWTGLALMPLTAWASVEPLRLASGGGVTAAEFGHQALVGPPGWLPQARPHQLLGIRVRDGRISVDVVDAVTSPQRDHQVRLALTSQYRNEAWWTGDELANRPAALNRAVGYALLQQPDLLGEPGTPLNELLYDALREDDRLNHFRNLRAWEAGDCVSFGVEGMPEALYMELNGRAEKYGMALDQFIILALGHLAWRTPFTDDLGPWESWDVQPEATSTAKLHALPTLDD